MFLSHTKRYQWLNLNSSAFKIILSHWATAVPLYLNFLLCISSLFWGSPTCIILYYPIIDMVEFSLNRFLFNLITILGTWDFCCKEAKTNRSMDKHCWYLKSEILDETSGFPDLQRFKTPSTYNILPFPKLWCWNKEFVKFEKLLGERIENSVADLPLPGSCRVKWYVTLKLHWLHCIFPGPKIGLHRSCKLWQLDNYIAAWSMMRAMQFSSAASWPWAVPSWHSGPPR